MVLNPDSNGACLQPRSGSTFLCFWIETLHFEKCEFFRVGHLRINSINPRFIVLGWPAPASSCCCHVQPGRYCGQETTGHLPGTLEYTVYSTLLPLLLSPAWEILWPGDDGPSSRYRYSRVHSVQCRYCSWTRSGWHFLCSRLPGCCGLSVAKAHVLSFLKLPLSYHLVHNKTRPDNQGMQTSIADPEWFIPDPALNVQSSGSRFGSRFNPYRYYLSIMGNKKKNLKFNQIEENYRYSTM